jgi:hypothetical protein
MTKSCLNPNTMTKPSIASGMSDKITRRQLAGVAAGSAAVSLVAARLIGQAPVAAQDWYNAARESHRENAEALAKFEIQMSLEPAFQFKA